MVSHRIARHGPAVAVAILAFVGARLALMPGVGFWDTGELQAVGPLMGTAHPTGYPTYVLLGWLASIVLAPFGEPAVRMNLLAALCVAAAAGITVDLVRALTRSAVLGVVAGLGFAFTEVVWSIGTHAEAHALHVLLVVVLVRLLLAWEAAHHAPGVAGEPGPAGDGAGWTAPTPAPTTRTGPTPRADRLLVAAAVVFGLAVGNHSLTLLLALPVGLYVLAVEPRIVLRPRLLLVCAGALAVTVVLVFLELPLRAGPFRAPLVYGSPHTWDGFWYIVLAEQFRGSLVDPFGDLTGKLADLAARTVDAFGPLAALVPLGLLATVMRHPRYALLTGTAVAITCLFAASYTNADIERYYLVPVFMAWTWLAILGALAVDAIGAAMGGEPVAVDPGVGPTSRPEPGPRLLLAIGLAVVLLAPTALALDGRFARVDRSRDDSAARWVDYALVAMEPDAMIVSWWSYSTPLWYAQHVEGRRPDVAIIDDRTRLDEHLGDLTDVIDANLPVRPVYVIRLDPAELRLLEERYALEFLERDDASGLTRVVGPREAGA